MTDPTAPAVSTINTERLTRMREQGSSREVATQLFVEYRRLMHSMPNSLAVEVRLLEWLARWDSICPRSISALRREIAHERREQAADEQEEEDS